MSFLLDNAAFQRLFPFSFVTDCDGRILLIGRSLTQVIPEASSTERYQDIFNLTRPYLGITDPCPKGLLGELIILSLRSNPELQLRGHVVQLSTTDNEFLFSLNFSLNQLSTLSHLGLTIGDFALGDPIFDLLIAIQSEALARKRAEASHAQAEQRNKALHLLHKLTLDTYELANDIAVYEKTVEAICAELSWEVGHVFAAKNDSAKKLVSTGIWKTSDPEAFKELKAASLAVELGFGEGLAGKSWSSRQVLWSSNVVDDPLFKRQDTLARLPRLIGVAIPLFSEGKVAAVMEFFTRKLHEDTEHLRYFFEVLGITISNVLSHQATVCKEREQLIQIATSAKMATLGELAAGVAHEINDPLSTLSLATQLLAREASSNPLLQRATDAHIQRISRATERIKKIVCTLKSFSRDSSTDPYTMVSGACLIHEALELCFARAMRLNVKIVCPDIPSDLTIECRGSQITQVLLNLLSNAIDAASESEERCVSLEVKDAGEFVHVAVTDSGRGVCPSIREKIMSPFFTTKPPGKGTGLGLSISQTITAEHRGSLVLDCKSPRTRFVLELPKRQTISSLCA